MNELSTLPPTRAMIGKWSVDRYVGLIRRWTLTAAILVMFGGLVGLVRTWTITFELLLVAALGVRVARQGGGKTESIMVGVFVGLTLGLASSLGRFLRHPNLANGVMIIIETAITAVLSLLISVSAALITTLLIQKKN